MEIIVKEIVRSKGSRRALRWLLPPVALLAALPMALGASSSASAEADEAGLIEVYNVASLAPGATLEKSWKHADLGVAHFVDVLPQPLPGQTCSFEAPRIWKTVTGWFGAPSDLTVYWQIKNVGTVDCAAQVRLGWVRP
jgi:hypothetical protein